MKLSLITTAALLALTAPAFAGDAANGEKEFKKCKACHAIVADDGTEIVKGGKVGPNLYGVVGRAAGGVADFKYSDVMKESGAKGLIWDEATLAAYLPDPSTFLEEFSGDAKGKSKMTFKLKKGGEDVAAYLASVGPAAK
ncbi:c-type cytochrome [Pseudorhodobacter wandonensis]|uniref:c-type cytochrome n=1 Tax=Pseudorhodobacter wandonensis TaxID=1120568 RepID=UPI00067E22DB|nr:cytochrome c [Pseudorhodobacter wandonensis]